MSHTPRHTKSEVTQARITDAPELLDIMREWHAENGTGVWCRFKAGILLGQGLRRDGGMIGVIRGKTTIEAAVGVYIWTDDMSTEPFLTERWNYVLEPYRRSDHAKALIGFSRDASALLGVPLIVKAIETPENKGKVDLYGRMLPRRGSIFMTHGQAA